ncbi:MAG: type II toxin-antitoxin system HicB family antitoxin [Planctomycetia bacterium]|nr:type II toxin-antitoxin system HicB family antitoxin [Planctomycetia bacterium]
MQFPVVLHKDKSSDYGVTVPDLPGCFSAGSSVDEALAMAKEAIEVYLEQLIEEGKPVPLPGRIEQHQKNSDYRGGVWAFVGVDQSTLRVTAKRINITLPERVLDAIDRFAEASGESRSGLLARAATEYIGRAGDTTLPTAKRGKRKFKVANS